MFYPLIALISVVIFAAIHLFAEKVRGLSVDTQGRFLSLGGGVAIAYVFIDLLPKLSKNNTFVQEALAGVFPYFERHVFVMALLGFILFYIVDRSTSSVLNQKQSFLLSIFSYALFNFFVGYAVVNKDNPETQPLLLFTLAMALHYFTNDYSLVETYGMDYRKTGKWILVGSLFLGWIIGIFWIISPMAIALISAFIGGGVIMNVTRHEIPKGNPNSLGAFLAAAFTYSAILLALHG